jgi:hypothetical protein
MSGRDGGTTRVNAATIRHTRGRCNERTTRGGFTGDVCQIFGGGGMVKYVRCGRLEGLF